MRRDDSAGFGEDGFVDVSLRVDAALRARTPDARRWVDGIGWTQPGGCSIPAAAGIFGVRFGVGVGVG
jgi:hypothetical protein